MKKKLLLTLSIAILLALVLCPAVFAVDEPVENHIDYITNFRWNTELKDTANYKNASGNLEPYQVVAVPIQPIQLALVVSFDSYSVLEGNKIVTRYTADIIDLDGKIYNIQTKNLSKSDQDLLEGVVCTYTISDSIYEFTPAPVEDSTEKRFHIRTNIDRIENNITTLSPNSFPSPITCGHRKQPN